MPSIADKKRYLVIYKDSSHKQGKPKEKTYATFDKAVEFAKLFSEGCQFARVLDRETREYVYGHPRSPDGWSKCCGTDGFKARKTDRQRDEWCIEHEYPEVPTFIR